jgi:orotidine-5'-phosphate decarboxylase
MDAAEKLIVALDFATLAEAEKVVKKVSPIVKVFKVGKELFTTAGPEAVHMVQRYKCRVFLDLKFHDIPNTVGAACEAAAKLGVYLMNVHTQGGRTMMTAAVQAVHKAAEGRKGPAPKVLGVTVLTSLTDRDLKEVGVSKNVKTQVSDMAKLAKASGLDGVVASAQEIALIRKATGKDFLIVTPGVRPVWAAHGDQKRVTTPREAVEAGADHIVVGRPITQHPQPLAAAEKILKEISESAR